MREKILHHSSSTSWIFCKKQNKKITRDYFLPQHCKHVHTGKVVWVDLWPVFIVEYPVHEFFLERVWKGEDGHQLDCPRQNTLELQRNTQQWRTNQGSLQRQTNKLNSGTIVNIIIKLLTQTYWQFILSPPSIELVVEISLQPFLRNTKQQH